MSNEEIMKISVVIPSYNPTLKLSDTIESLVIQSSLVWELIIVIDNEQYAGFGKKLQEKYASVFNLKIEVQSNSGRAATRNKGAYMATGDIILFLDDDMIAEGELLMKHIKFHSENINAIVSGNGYNKPEDAKSDFQAYMVEVEKRRDEFSQGPVIISMERFGFTACNMSVPKQIFDTLGGFDNRLKDGEDFDFGIRALKSGIRIVYDRALVAWHNNWPDIKQYIKRHNEYTEGKNQLLKYHPEYAPLMPAFKLVKKSKIEKLIRSIFRNTIGRIVISDNLFFRILPRKLKYMLYHLTIAASSNF